MTIEEIKAKMAELRARVTELRDAAQERELNADETNEADEKMAEFEQLRTKLEEMEARDKRVSAMQDLDLTVETTETGEDRSGDRGTFRTNAGSRIPDNIHDLAEYDKRSNNVEERNELLRDGALKWIEKSSFPNVRGASNEDTQEHIARLVDSVQGQDALCRRLVATGSREYARAFGKLLSNGGPEGLSNEERQLLHVARSLTTTESGYAVPPTIDPTVTITAAGSWNPFRAISRVVQVAGDHSGVWKGITSAGITASYDAEDAEVSDDTPALSQPSITLEKAQSLITFSIEAAMDWSALQAEMATEFADAKDRLEEIKFAIGAGHGSNEPQGVITGATVNYTTLATSVTPALADFTAMQDALDARWERNAVFVMNKKLVSKIRNLAVAAGYAQDWSNVSTGGETGGDQLVPLFGDPIYRSTSISGAYGTAATKVAVYGDFRQFVIVDRVGMSVELVPHIFNTANNLPDGRRGLYCYWRNSSGVLTTSAFVVAKSS